MNSTPDTPASIGRFRIDAVLGRGGMGEVYKAFDPTLHRTVALKTVRPGIESREYLDRLYREAQACAQLTHPNIVTVFDAGEIGGSVYIAMEYVTGDTLATILQRGGLTFEERMTVLLQMLDALQAAHEGGVIHRDVKPANVIRQPNGTIKLVDFGLARTEDSEPLTQTGVVMGTLDYASPEQLRGEHVDHRSDIYSTGIVAYELVAGKRPFVRNTDLPALIYKIVHEPPPPLNEYVRTTFPVLNEIVMRAIAKSPDDRYLSAIAMREALAAFVRDSHAQIAAMQLARAREDDPDARTGEAARLRSTAAATTARAVPIAAAPVPPARRVSNAWLAAGLAAAVAVFGALLYVRSDGSPSTADRNTNASRAAITDVPARIAESQPSENLTSPASPAAAASPPPGASAGPAAPGAAASVASAVTAAPPPEPGAKDLYDVSGGTMVRTGLHYHVILLKPGGTEVEVDPADTVFKDGDCVRFAFETNVDGFLYVVHQGTSGAWTRLFPETRINRGMNGIRRGELYSVPEAEPDKDGNVGCFGFHGAAGTEQLFVMLSKERRKDLPGFDPTTPKAEAVLASAMGELQQQWRSRDLVYEKVPAVAREQPGLSTYVVNRSELDQAVAATITLTHGK